MVVFLSHFQDVSGAGNYPQWLDRLGDEIVESELQSLLFIFSRCLGGQHDNGCFGGHRVGPDGSQ